MQYLNAKQTAENWGITVRRIQDLCRSGAIEGAVRWGRDWMIPVDAHRPVDRRRRDVKPVAEHLPGLTRRNPAIVMTDLYHKPGSFYEATLGLNNWPKTQALFRAQMLYCQGDVEESLDIALALLREPCGHDQQIGCGIILAMCAIYRGDIPLWSRSREVIRTAECHNPKDDHLSKFWAAAMDSEIYDTSAFPSWFQHGSFDALPGDTFPAARYYYLRHLFVRFHEAAVGHFGERDRMASMRMLPLIAEPLISQTHRERVAIVEIYLRLVCAAAYHRLDNEAMAIRHLDAAIELALPDKLYMLLAEHRLEFDFLMDERLNIADPAATVQVRALSKQMRSGWTHLHNTLLGRKVSVSLTTREREVAKNAAIGLSNKEIAQRLHISVDAVKQSLRSAMDKTDAQRRSDLYPYL